MASLGLGVATLATWAIAIVANGDGDKYDWIWPIMAVFGLAALITGFTAREGEGCGAEHSSAP